MSTGSDQLALAKLMDFGTLVLTARGETRAVAAPLGMTRPEEIQYVDLDEGGSITGEPEAPRGWEYLTFRTGEHMVGPTAIMTPANVITGGIAEYILSRPGYYCAVMIDGYLPSMTDDEIDMQSVGWGVLHYIGGDK